MKEEDSGQAEKNRISPARPHRMFRRMLLVVVLLLLGALLADAFLYDRWSPAPDGSAFNQSANAILLDGTWVSDDHTESDIRGLAAELTDAEISLVFADCGSADSSGRLPDRDDARAMALLAGLRTASPELTALGVVRVTAGLRLDAPGVGKTLVNEAAALVTVVGFDGVQYDLETISAGGADASRLAEETRKVLGDAPLLSIAAPLPLFRWPGANRTWNDEHYAQLARDCDILVLKCPAMPIPWPRAYVALTASQVRQMTGVVEQANPNCWLYVGVSAPSGNTRAGIQAMPLRNAIKGVTAALRSPGARPVAFHGLALYTYETATEKDWQQWDTMWLGRR